jgi:hypothetical protein
VTQYALHTLPRLLDKLADLLVKGCSNIQHTVAALIVSMTKTAPEDAKRFTVGLARSSLHVL